MLYFAAVCIELKIGRAALPTTLCVHTTASKNVIYSGLHAVDVVDAIDNTFKCALMK